MPTLWSRWARHKKVLFHFLRLDTVLSDLTQKILPTLDKLNKITEVSNSANSLFKWLLICCHPEILLPWQCDAMTSPLYCKWSHYKGKHKSGYFGDQDQCLSLEMDWKKLHKTSGLIMKINYMMYFLFHFSMCSVFYLLDTFTPLFTYDNLNNKFISVQFQLCNE